MARFKIFSTIEKKFKSASAKGLAKAGKKSIEWFKSQIKTRFGRKIIDKGNKEWSSKDIDKQPHVRQPRTITDPKLPPRDRHDRETSTVKQNLGKNTSFDAEFKKNITNVARPQIGRMYFYIYDPKWKKILPYFDVFPLTIPINYYDNGFLGLNLHYLPYLLRAKLMDTLLSLQQSTTVGGNEEKYLKISYGILKGLSNNKYFRPTIHRYLYNHVKSPYAQVASPEWEVAAFMPVEQFRKANKREVWADSRAAT